MIHLILVRNFALFTCIYIYSVLLFTVHSIYMIRVAYEGGGHCLGNKAIAVEKNNVNSVAAYQQPDPSAKSQCSDFSDPSAKSQCSDFSIYIYIYICL